ncbi:hypothetical protein LPU83_pLPU83b_0011 (plasmid) [Rhizobium favelukesii]|uniref:Uncharacterized protein n=1 Tax=Rhizobium favelukesii TaxID=348824 RepID=W6S0K8_9HYPH|nr:hypothetical protein LPU83_pLPU83b_0011 [Rhizobium favelukesii]
MSLLPVHLHFIGEVEATALTQMLGASLDRLGQRQVHLRLERHAVSPRRQ